MTLLECVEVAKSLTYVPPEGKTFDQYTYDEVQIFALSQLLQNHVQVYAVILICQKYGFAKPIFKSALKDYIVRFGGENMVPGKKRKF